MKNRFTDFVEADKNEYVSIIDEYRRFKYFRYHTNFKCDDQKLVYEYLLKSIKHMFKVKRELVVGLEFGLNVKNTYTDYTIKEIDADRKYVRLIWNVENDEYELEFIIKKNGSKTNILFKQMIHRERTFFGMADYAGILLYKRAFKSNMKAFAGYIKNLIENNGVFFMEDKKKDKPSEGSKDEAKSVVPPTSTPTKPTPPKHPKHKKKNKYK